MVRAGVIEHPAEWPHSGYREIQEPPERYAVIDLVTLSTLCGFTHVAHFQKAHRQWVEEALTRHATARDDRWSEAIAVGSRTFVDKVKTDLGIKAKYREVTETGGAHTLREAVSQYAAWQAAGLQQPIAVNVSAVQLKRRDFVTSVQQAIAIAGKSGHGLDIEITESMIMEDIESSIGKLKIIRDLGVGISIDDFGTGHSSLRYLTRLPITALKIDRAFIQHMTTNPDDVAIVSTVIALGHNLNLKVIAEGVETEEQSKFLRLLKCDQFQGYLFSKPVPAEQVPALLTG